MIFTKYKMLHEFWKNIFSSFNLQIMGCVFNKEITPKNLEDWTKATVVANLLFSDVILEVAKEHSATRGALDFVHGELSYIVGLKQNKPIPADRKHCFLSHCQGSHGDFCRSLYLSLKADGVSCWYDKESTRLDARGMIDGIYSSSEFIMILDKLYFTRP